jgi:hypothetical protein
VQAHYGQWVPTTFAGFVPGCRVDGKPVLLHFDGSAIKHEWIIRPKDILAIEELYGG